MKKFKIGEVYYLNGLNVNYVKGLDGKSNCASCAFLDHAYDCNNIDCTGCYFVKSENKPKSIENTDSLKLSILSEINTITTYFKEIKEDKTISNEYNPKSFARGKYFAYKNVLNKINQLKNN